MFLFTFEKKVIHISLNMAYKVNIQCEHFAYKYIKKRNKKQLENGVKDINIQFKKIKENLNKHIACVWVIIKLNLKIDNLYLLISLAKTEITIYQRKSRVWVNRPTHTVLNIYEKHNTIFENNLIIY